MTINWWPGLPGDTWAWEPALSLGAVAIALLPTLLVLLGARARGVSLHRPQRWLLLTASGTLVLTLGWPLGDLARVSLAARTAQYLLITLAAAPLLLSGIPRWRARGRHPARRAMERALAHPLIGAAVLGIVVWVTHLPVVVDGAEASAWGEAATRAGWILAAFVFWWPLIGPGPARERLPYLAGLGYLFLPFAFPKFPAAVWVFSSDPVYEAFEGLARPGGLSATADQGLAGFVLWLPGSAMVGVAVYLLIRHWAREDGRLALRQRLGIPADPGAIALLVSDPPTWRALESLVAIIDAAAPPRSGADLTFAVNGRQVVLQLHFHGSEDEQHVLGEEIDRQYQRYLARFAGPRAQAISSTLSAEVLPYGTRVQ